ncbi:MAG: nucleotide sugar dehydrogenase [Spirochaetaceae bacterium]|nr:MAG: nucleotide sugar dehydrogenase [Spirochaetaceae bacterium]
MDNKKAFLQKIEQGSVKVGVLGLGYVGLPLAVTFALKDVEVLGFEKNPQKAEMVNRAENYIEDVADQDLISTVQNKKLSATSDFSRIAECDALIICVPTPLDRFKKPDMSYIEGACQEIGKHMKPGSFICLESTTFPTTTENVMQPIIAEVSGLESGKDFWLAFSPERVDPGNTEYKTANTPKVIGALTGDGLEIGMALYGLAIETLYPVSSPRVAEMVKILENTYRLVNISMINELALLAGKMDINIWEVIDAAKTKPYGFQAFYPGPGIGGHCIPLDPFYLEYIAKNYNFDLTMIHTAGHIDNLMPHRMTIKITTALNRRKKAVNGSSILFMGVAYKPDIADERESPALKIMDEVAKKGGEVMFHDPYIAEVRTPEGRIYKNQELQDSLIKKADCVVFTTNHAVFDVHSIIDKADLVVDLRNVTLESSDKVYKL